MASWMRGQYDSAVRGAMGRSTTADRDFYNRATSFDPYAAVEQTAMGSYNLLADQLDRRLKGLRGQQVGMGRLNTGFATSDEDDLVREGRDQLTNMLLAASMNAAQMDLSRTNMLGSYAGQQQQNYYDLLSSGLDREQAAANARRQSRDSLLGGALGLAGDLLPGSGLLKAGGKLLGGLFG